MIWRLLQNEITLTVRSQLPYFGLLATGLICALTYVAADQLNRADTANAWGFVSLSMQLAFSDIGLVFIIVFATLLMAEERSSGTLQMILSSPVYRWELYLAKALVGLLYMLVMSLTCLTLSAILAACRYDFGRVADSLGTVYGTREVTTNFLVACLLSWIPLCTLVLYGLLLSTLIRRPGAAVAVGLGSIYLIDFTKHLVGLDPYIFTRYISYPWQVFHQVAGGVDYQWQPEMWRMIALCGASALAALAAGLYLFQRQDLNAS